MGDTVCITLPPKTLSDTQFSWVDLIIYIYDDTLDVRPHLVPFNRE